MSDSRTKKRDPDGGWQWQRSTNSSPKSIHYGGQQDVSSFKEKQLVDLKIFPIHYYFVFLTQGLRRSVNGMVVGLAGGDLDILHHSIADMNDPAFKKSHLFILMCVTHRASGRSFLLLAGVFLAKIGGVGKKRSEESHLK